MNSPEESVTELKASNPEAVMQIVTEETELCTAPTERSATAVWILALIALVAALYLARFLCSIILWHSR